MFSFRWHISRHIGLWLLALLSSSLLMAQDSKLSNPNVNQESFGITDGREVTTISATPMNNSGLGYADGAAFLNGGWQKGRVIFLNNTRYEGRIRFDLVKNQLQFYKAGAPNLFADPVLCFFLFDSTGDPGKTYYFQSQYPEFGTYNKETFYMVTCFGSNIQLLKYIGKKPVEQYQYNIASKVSLKLTEEWYIYDTNENKVKYAGNRTNALQKLLSKYISDIRQVLPGAGKTLTEAEMIQLCNTVNHAKPS